MSSRDRTSRAELARLLLALGIAVSEDAPLDERLTTICKSMTELLDCDRSSVFLTNGTHFVPAANHGNPPDVAEFFPRARFRLSDPLFRKALDSNTPIHIADAASSPLVSAAVADSARIRSLVVGPVATSGANQYGVITAEFNETDAAFSRFDVVVVEGLARMAATMLASHHAADRERVLRDQLQWQAGHDSLTGLPNRRSLASWFERITAADGTVVLLLADIDRFKLVNDALGHPAGDRLLAEIAQRLRQCFPAGPDIQVSRFGGDEFVIAALVPDPSAAQSLADRVARALHAPVELGDEQALRVTASVGIAVATAAEADADDLLRDADAAMYVAKRERRGHSVLAHQDHRPVVSHRFDLEVALSAALADGSIRPWFQPVLDVRTGRWVALEALARWSHPMRGIVRPDAFLPAAEEMGLLQQLTDTMVAQASAVLDDPDLRDLTLFLNISAADVDHALIERLLSRFDRPSQLVVELTEHTAIEHRDSVREILTELREAGVRVALDDFGTGYSSISTLERLPLDILKLDRSLIASSSAVRRAAVMQSTAALGRSLDLQVLAEGVELDDELEAVAFASIDLAQGHLLGRPMPAADLVTARSGNLRSNP